MIGYFASFFSLKMKKKTMKHPKMIKHMTVGDFHGNVVPPKSSPRSSMTVKPRIERLPNQSTAFRPSSSAVLGLWTSKKRNNSMNVMKQTGRLIQKHHLQSY